MVDKLMSDWRKPTNNNNNATPEIQLHQIKTKPFSRVCLINLVLVYVTTISLYLSGKSLTQICTKQTT